LLRGLDVAREQGDAAEIELAGQGAQLDGDRAARKASEQELA